MHTAPSRGLADARITHIMVYEIYGSTTGPTLHFQIAPMNLESVILGIKRTIVPGYNRRQVLFLGVIHVGLSVRRNCPIYSK